MSAAIPADAEFIPLARRWLTAVEHDDTTAAAAIRRQTVGEAAWAAANLARNRQWAVLPCSMPDKRPACPHGLHDATSDPNAVAELWRRYPGDLVAVRTGDASGIDVLDVDVKHPEARAWWHENHYRFPSTRAYRTLGGGAHLYLQHADGVRNDQGKKVCTGVDVRGEGGYIVFWFAAGLECLNNAPPAPWPSWLLELVRPPPKPVTTPKILARPYGGPDRGIPALLRVVATAPEGQRNGSLYWASRRFAERVTAGHVGRGEAEAELMRAALHVGLPETEARRTIHSGLRNSS